MKVAYVAESVAPYRVGGMQAIARRHADGLKAHGFDVVLVHASRRSEGGHEVPAASGPRERELPWPARTGLLGRLPGHYARDLVAYSRLVDAVLREEAPDVVYAEGPVVLHTLRSPRASRPPVVFHPHGLEPFQRLGRWRDDLRSRPMRPLLAAHAQRAERVLSQGGDLTRILRERLGVPEARLCVLPNGLPADALAERPRGPRRPRRFLFVGRDEPRKGLRLLVDAVLALPEARLDVVGANVPRRGVGATERIQSHGVVRDPAALRALYDSADVLVLPSLAEGMPTVLLEALGRGIPVVASAVGAVPDLVEDGVTGWLVPPGSPARLRAALAAVLALPDEAYESLSRAALSRVREGFLEDRVVGRLATILGEAASGERPAREPASPRAEAAT